VDAPRREGRLLRGSLVTLNGVEESRRVTVVVIGGGFSGSRLAMKFFGRPPAPSLAETFSDVGAGI